MLVVFSSSVDHLLVLRFFFLLLKIECTHLRFCVMVATPLLCQEEQGKP